MQTRTSHTVISFSFLMLTLLTIEGCKLGYKTPSGNGSSSTTPPPKCNQTPTNSNADDNTLGVFNLLSDLSCGALTRSNDGYLMGQSLGNGNQIIKADHPNSYAAHITAFANATKKTPALIAIDYEYDRLYNLEELIEANEKLDAHWQKGGFVTITWSPLNPWTNDAQNLTDFPGSQDETKYSEEVNLANLLDDSTEISGIWRKKLDAVAEALANLQSRDDVITVLWRPLPEMNTTKYWWGLNASVNANNEPDASLYKNLWQDMYEYFKEDKALKNLLWVYSPGESAEDNNTKVDWAYPGENFVDIVAGIARNDQLNIKDYTDLIKFDKPLGMAEYGPKPAGQFSATGTFDNQTYADRLDGSYNYISYWVSWHSTDGAKQALIDNKNSAELTKRSYIFNAEDKKRD